MVENASLAMKRIMKEYRDMQQKKQVYLYARPLDVRYLLSDLTRINLLSGTSQSEGLQRQITTKVYTTAASACPTTTLSSLHTSCSTQ
jgi:ubiquitin-protein ligase